MRWRCLANVIRQRSDSMPETGLVLQWLICSCIRECAQIMGKDSVLQLEICGKA